MAEKSRFARILHFKQSRERVYFPVSRDDDDEIRSEASLDVTTTRHRLSRVLIVFPWILSALLACTNIFALSLLQSRRTSGFAKSEFGTFEQGWNTDFGKLSPSLWRFNS